MVSTLVAASDCWPGLAVIASRLNFLPRCDASGGCIPKRWGPPSPSLAVCDTVMSVPTPYSECSTSSWASLTPPA